MSHHRDPVASAPMVVAFCLSTLAAAVVAGYRITRWGYDCLTNKEKAMDDLTSVDVSVADVPNDGGQAELLVIVKYLFILVIVILVLRFLAGVI